MAKMPIEEFKFLRDNRKYIRTSVTRKCNSVENGIDSMDLDKCSSEIDSLKSMGDQLEKLNTELSKGLWTHVTDRGELDRELEHCQEYREKLMKAIKLLERRSCVDNLDDFHESNNRSVPLSQLKLPQLPLPIFGNRGDESLQQFFDNFEAVISKYNVSDFEKFIFLKQQLFNEPLTLISSLQGSQRSYKDAKELLEKAFASPLLQKFAVIKKMAELYLSPKGDPYKFVSDLNIIVSSFDSLEVETDEILQYFTWQAMPDVLKTHLTQITNDSNPSVEEIQEHIFTAITRA